jgi:capsular polysaccharide transport system ATP-binding protein
MRNRLSFALTFAFEFDTYLLDDFNFSSDSILAEKAEKFIAVERKNSRLIFTTKSIKKIKEDCDCALLLEDNKLTFFENIDTAIEQCKKMLKNDLNDN